MKALTLYPEWSHAICHLGKRIENRTWWPRGILKGEAYAIHAEKHIGGKPGSDHHAIEALMDVASMSPIPGSFQDVLESLCVDRTAGRIKMSSIVAIVNHIDAIKPGELRPGAEDWAVEEMWNWRFSMIAVLPEPIPCPGKQGLWTVSPGTSSLIDEQLKNIRRK